LNNACIISISAAFAAKPQGIFPTPQRLTYENRGVSFSIGMDEDANTVANFIKYYQPKLVGGSVGKHIAEIW